MRPKNKVHRGGPRIAAESILRGLIEANPESVVLLATDGTILYTNEAFARRVKSTAKNLAGQRVYDYFPPAVGARRKAHVDEVVATGKAAHFEDRRAGRDISNHIYPILDSRGKVSRLAVFGIDITAQKKAAEIIRSEARFPAENPNPILRIARTGRLLYANEACRSLLSDLVLAVGKPAPEEMRSIVHEALRTGEAKTLDIQWGERMISFFVAPISRAGYANLYGLDVSARARAEREMEQQNFRLQELNRSLAAEIEERKRLEEILCLSEDKFEKAFRTSPDSININRLSDGIFVDINDGFTTITGFTRDDVHGKSAVDLGIWAYPADRARLVDELQSKGEARNLAADFRTKDGTILHGLMSARIIQLNNEPHILSITRDITERKRREEQIQAALLEKEVLLKEIHHRVKNNLQVISSLLHLQSEHMEHEESRKALRESQQRVRSMALVHEELYRSENLAGIPFGEYVGMVTSELLRNYGRSDIRLSLQIDPVSLQIDKAIPCGLIVNELVSNALLHAFPRERKGSVTVMLRRTGPGKIELAVRDDGVGFPEVADVRLLSSMGMTLVVSLADQLQGSVSLSREEGTTIAVTFPEQPSARMDNSEGDNG